MSETSSIRQGIYQSPIVRRMARWLDAIPHPMIACEIATDYVAAARWNRAGTGLDSFAVEPLPAGAILPTAAESNLINAGEVRSAVARVFSQLRAKNEEVALLVPDAVIRVFVLHFDSFPRKSEDAIPMLKWRLKKSVPFEAEETLISYMRQAPRDDGVDIVTGLARLRIVREYESLLEAANMTPGVVISSTLAALPLLTDGHPALLARVAGSILTTAIVREGILCGYRCVTLPADAAHLTPQALLDEIYPLAAYYQDSWSEGIAQVRLAGLGERSAEFQEPLERELQCPVGPLLAAAAAEGRIRPEDSPLAERGLDALIGWTLNRGA
ncbi:MAG: type IV pilus biogenesis protein PilM [Bryobacteraceae bacterium]